MRTTHLLRHAVAILLIFVGRPEMTVAAPCIIQVIDSKTERGIPLVLLKTVDQSEFWTDSAGLVAFEEPGWMDREVYFRVSSPGYRYPKDGFGNAGVRLRTTPGSSHLIRMDREQIAERLYRITGAGIYRDTLLAGRQAPIRHPLLNSQVTGQDTVIKAVYRNKIYWFWGDTDRISYPLGNFNVSGATSELPGKGGLEQSIGIDLTYWTNSEGFTAPMCPKEKFGPGIQWIESVFVLPAEKGGEQLLARVASGTGLSPSREWHLARFDDEHHRFEPLVAWNIHDAHASMHPFQVDHRGERYLYLNHHLRVPARLEAVRDLSRYETYSCLAVSSNQEGTTPTVVRDKGGRAVYSWKREAPRSDHAQIKDLLGRNILHHEDLALQGLDLETGAAVSLGGGSVAWNEYHRRWVMISPGKPGEIWWSEADTPTGPWIYARRIAEHGKYNFYNPTQHPVFDQEGGKLVYFEGTYTAAFSGAPAKTPRYDYNQLMYRLTLSDPRLTIPTPIYQLRDSGRYATRETLKQPDDWARVDRIAFFAIAPFHSFEGGVKIWSTAAGDAFQTVPPTPETPPLFIGLPPEMNPPAATNLHLSLDLLKNGEGRVIAQVWKNPIRALPLDHEARPVANPASSR